MSISGKVALVTGAANGIGLQFVKALVANGAKGVSILDINENDGVKAASEINDKYGALRASFHKCDVTNKGELEDAFRRTTDKFKSLDIVLNGAGIMKDNQWEKEVDLNVKGVVNGVLLGFEYMGKDKRGKGGTILNIASIFGLYACPETPVYCGTKHAVIGISRAFGDPYHFEKTGVRVMAVCPGATDTKLLAESKENMLTEEWNKRLAKKISMVVTQKPEDVANGMIHMLRHGQSGSVWVVEKCGPPYEICIPPYETLKVSNFNTDVGAKETEAEMLQ